MVPNKTLGSLNRFDKVNDVSVLKKQYDRLMDRVRDGLNRGDLYKDITSAEKVWIDVFESASTGKVLSDMTNTPVEIYEPDVVDGSFGLDKKTYYKGDCVSIADSFYKIGPATSDLDTYFEEDNVREADVREAEKVSPQRIQKDVARLESMLGDTTDNPGYEFGV